MKRFACVLGLALTLSLAGIGQSARAQAPVPVRVAVIGSGGQAEVTDAIKAFGLDTKYGFALEVVDYAQPGQQYTMFRSGAIDIAAAGNFVDLLRQRRAGVKIRAFHGYQTFSNQIVVKPDSPIKTFADLRGRKVGQFGTTFLDWLIVRAAGKKAFGLDLEKEAEIVQGAPPTLNQFLDRGEVQATLQFRSLTLAPVLRGTQRVVSDLPSLLRAADFSTEVFYTLWLVGDAWTDTHPGALEKFNAMVDEAYETLKKDDAIWTALAKRVGITDPALVAAYRDDERRNDNPPYSRALLAPTQTLLDALVAISGESTIGTSKLDPEAFWFPK